jgi:hypothetical protein
MSNSIGAVERMYFNQDDRCDLVPQRRKTYRFTEGVNHGQEAEATDKGGQYQGAT